ncbi:T9SS type A sorting domain-containing protein [Paraflavisolibacter sp. H34]|uniref:T9SS type A sorting domain-containing protein n=1 Tax=Huijunlia imazamoxiresistens TaxID=3127457 RepID=UPI003019367C
MRSFLRQAAFSACLITTLQVSAQNDQFAYAITDLSKDGMGWNALRKLNLQTGTYSQVLLDGTNGKTVAFDAATKKQIEPQLAQRTNTFGATPFGAGVAAMAFDKKHNRLYFTPMFHDELRYLDLSSMQLYYFSGQPFTTLANPNYDQGRIVTRMVIAPDGNGYAVTSDGDMLVKFTTGKTPTITQLGALIDDPSNNGVSIHSKCSSYGGDMISDDKGNLYIITARNHVFKVNTDTRVAKSLGNIEGLPADFTANGAVVDAEGNLLVSSAINNSGYYVVDIETLKATLFAGMTDVFRSSDLANSNYLSSASRNPTKQIETIAAPQASGSNSIKVFPNPAVTDHFTVQFNNISSGDYTIELRNLVGQQILQKRISINGKYHAQQVSLAGSNARGVYLVKVLDLDRKTMFESKLMIR